MLGFALMMMSIGDYHVKREEVINTVPHLTPKQYKLLKQKASEEATDEHCKNCPANGMCVIQNIAKGDFDDIAATDTAT